MYYDENEGLLNFAAGLAIGVAIGAGIALLLAPQSGRRVRRRLKDAVAGVRESAGERWGDLGDDVRSAMDAGRRRLGR